LNALCSARMNPCPFPTPINRHPFATRGAEAPKESNRPRFTARLKSCPFAKTQIGRAGHLLARINPCPFTTGSHGQGPFDRLRAVSEVEPSSDRGLFPRGWRRRRSLMSAKVPMLSGPEGRHSVAQGVSPGIRTSPPPLLPLPRARRRGRRRYRNCAGEGARRRGAACKPTANAVGHVLPRLPGLFVRGKNPRLIQGPN
jgi:hypothetical protein